VVELTTAIHYVFDTPADRLVWTSAPMLSAQDIDRQAGPESGRSAWAAASPASPGARESEYDAIVRTSTQIGDVGFCDSRTRLRGAGKAIAVIGDGRCRRAMAYRR